MSLTHSAAVGAAISTCLIVSAAFAQEPAAPNAAQTAQAVALVTEGVSAKPAGDAACPRVVVLRGGESFPKSDVEGYQATVGGLARDCANLGAETLLKVGVVGQATRSGAKGPSWFNAPLSITVIDDRGQAVAMSKAKLKIQLPRGKTEGPFTHLAEDVSLPPANGYAGWSVVVGFGTTTAQAQQAAKVLTARR